MKKVAKGKKSSKEKKLPEGLDLKLLYAVHGNPEPKLITNKTLVYLNRMFNTYLDIFYKENQLLFFNNKKQTQPFKATEQFETFVHNLNDALISDIFHVDFLVDFFNAYLQLSEEQNYGERALSPIGMSAIRQDYLDIGLQFWANKAIFKEIKVLLSFCFFVFPNQKKWILENFLGLKLEKLVSSYKYGLKQVQKLLTDISTSDWAITVVNCDPKQELLLQYFIIYLTFMKNTVNSTGNLEIKKNRLMLFLSVYDYLLAIKNNFTLLKWCDQGNRVMDYLTMIELVNEFTYYAIISDTPQLSSTPFLKKVGKHLTDYLDYYVATKSLINYNRLIRHPKMLTFQGRYYFIENPKFKKERPRPKPQKIATPEPIKEVEEVKDSSPAISTSTKTEAQVNIEDTSTGNTQESNSDHDSENEVLEDDVDYLKTYLDFHPLNNVPKSSGASREVDVPSKSYSSVHVPQDKSFTAVTHKNSKKNTSSSGTTSDNVEVISIYYFKEMRKSSLDLLEKLFFYLNKREFKPLSIENNWNIDKTILDLYIQNEKKFEDNANFRKHPENFIDVVIELEILNCIDWLMKKYKGFTASDIESILVQSNYDYEATVQILSEASKGNFKILEEFAEEDTGYQNTYENSVEEFEPLVQESLEPSTEAEISDSAESDYSDHAEIHEPSISSDTYTSENETDNDSSVTPATPALTNEAPRKEASLEALLNEDACLNEIDPSRIDYDILAEDQIKDTKESKLQFLSKLTGVPINVITTSFKKYKAIPPVLKEFWSQIKTTDGSSQTTEEYEVEEISTVPHIVTEEVEIILNYEELKIWKEMFPQVPNHILKEKYYNSNGDGEALLALLDKFLATDIPSNDQKQLLPDFSKIDFETKILLDNEMYRFLGNSNYSGDMSLDDAIDICQINLTNGENEFSLVKDKVRVVQNYLSYTLQFAEYFLFISDYDIAEVVVKSVLQYEEISSELKKKFQKMKSINDYNKSFNLVVCKSYDKKSGAVPKFRTPQFYPRTKFIKNLDFVKKYLYFVENISDLKLFNRTFVLKVLQHMNINIQKSLNLLILLSELGKIDYINSRTSHLEATDLVSDIRKYVTDEFCEVVEIETLDSPLIKKVESETTKTIKKKVKKQRMVEQSALETSQNYSSCPNKKVIDDAISDFLSSCVITLAELEKAEALYLVALAVEKWWDEELRQRLVNNYTEDESSKYTLVHYIWPIDIIKQSDDTTVSREICESVCEFLTSQRYLIINSENFIEVVGKISENI